MKSNAELYFIKTEQAINKAANINDLLNALPDEPDLKKRLNKLFKGNFQKSQYYCLKLIREYENTYFSESSDYEVGHYEYLQDSEQLKSFDIK